MRVNKNLLFLIAMLTVIVTFGAQAGVMASEMADEMTNAYFYSENAGEVNIQDAGIYTVILKANTGWSFTVSDGTDVTSWLVNKNGEPIILNDSNVAFAKNREEEYLEGNALIIEIDASKIAGFTHNGTAGIFILPPEGSMWVAGDNKGFYNESIGFIGKYTLPVFEIEGQLYGERTGGELSLLTDTITLALSLDEVDDDLIDSSNVVIKLAPGDGYDLSHFDFTPGTIGAVWLEGKTAYTMSADDIIPSNLGYDVVGGGRAWSEQGGDGNGHYYINVQISGVTYNGLPVADVTFPVHIYVYGRTFTVEGGSLIKGSQPKWSTTAENDLPVLCDEYPDDLNITWPIGFDASQLTAEDFNLVLRSRYEDELTLKPYEEYNVTTSVEYTTITVKYIHWANTPVYTTLTVDVDTENLDWNKEMYLVDKVSHTYDIASVYSYYVLGGGLSGTLTWSFYGVEGFTRWDQLFDTMTYRLSCVGEEGVKYYYTEDGIGRGKLVSIEQDALPFDASADCNTEIRSNVAYCNRPEDMTEEKSVDGKTIIFIKEYDNPEFSLRAPSDSIGVTPREGYILHEDDWMAHGRWSWQIFINEGFQGGTK